MCAVVCFQYPFIISLSLCIVISVCLIQGRDHLTHEKERFAHEHAQMKKLEDVVKKLKPTAIIGIYIYKYTLLLSQRFLLGLLYSNPFFLLFRGGSYSWRFHGGDNQSDGILQ